MRAGPSQDEIRRHNLGALLRLVHLRGPMSRAELTTRLGLNRSTIGALTADLAGAGLVTERAPRETRRAGRPSLVVSLRSDAVCAYALSVEVDRVRAARVGLGGVVLDQRELPREPGRPGEDAIEPLASFVADMHAAIPHDVRCIGTGVAISARVRAKDGTIRIRPPTDWDDPLRAALSPVLRDDRPVTVGAAADVAARAEHSRGVAAGCHTVIYLHGDGGVSAGVIAGGRPVTGHAGYVGDVGHVVVHPGGRACGCGSRGCWETEIGEHALLRAAGGAHGDTGRTAVLAVVQSAARGDAAAQLAIRQVGDWLGFGVANLVNIFNPEMIIFGEMLRDLYLSAAASVRSRLRTMVLPRCRDRLRLRTPALGDDAALIGAAELAFEQLLGDPLDSIPRSP